MTPETTLSPTDTAAPDTPVSTPQPIFYRVNGAKFKLRTFRDVMPGHKALFHLLRLKLRDPTMFATVDDVPVASLEPFRVGPDGLNPEVRTWFETVTAELSALGFHSAAYHDLDDHLNKAGYAIATFAHASSPIVARLRVRAWFVNHKPQVTNYLEFITAFADGTFLRTLPGKGVASSDHCHVRCTTFTSVPNLLQTHQDALAAHPSTSPALPASTQDEAIAIGESLHQANRDDLLKSGVLQPLTPADTERRSALAAGYKAASAAQSKHHIVLGELEALIQKKTTWAGTLVLLAISLALFIALGLRGVSLLRVLALVPILLVHELGHYLAMKAFGYRNLRMFFIPGFGAAVTGRHFNVAGWKKAIVYLMGPLPGILIGIILGLCGILWSSPLLTQAALLTMLINGSNLIPMLPFDGGHVVQLLLFGRYRALDLTFRFVTAAAMFAIAAFAGLKFFYVIGGLVFVGALGAMHIGKVVEQLQREGVPTQSTDDHSIPTPVAVRIIDKLIAASKRPAAPKVLANQTLQVFEALNTVPPRLFATIGLASTYILALVAAIFFSMIIAFAQGGTLSRIVESARNRPTHAIATPLSYTASPVPKPPFDCAVASFPKTAAAIAAFDDVRTATQGDETISRFADTIIVRLPAGDDAARKRWLELLQAKTPSVFVTSKGATADFHFQIFVSGDANAVALQSELKAYFNLPLAGSLAAPWGPPLDPKVTSTRATFGKLMDAYDRTWEDPELDALSDRIEEARRKGDLKEAKSLGAQRASLEDQVRLRLVRAAAAEAAAGADAEFAARFVAIVEDNAQTKGYSSFHLTVVKELAPLLGRANPDDLTYATTGYPRRSGPVIDIYTTFADPAAGAIAFSQWLVDHGASRVNYDVDLGVDDEYLDEEPEDDATQAPPAGGQ